MTELVLKKFDGNYCCPEISLIIKVMNSDDKKLNKVKFADSSKLIMAQFAQMDGDIVKVSVVLSSMVNKVLNLSHNSEKHKKFQRKKIKTTPVGRTKI